jgi:hypothetical protein
VTAAGRQRGAALLWALSLGILVGAALLLDRPPSTGVPSASREAATARRLADAERALIAWSVTVPATAGRSTTPGLLPFPDRNRDNNYDGRGDCVTFGLNDTHLLGRLPWAGDVSPCPRIGLHIDIRDGWGEFLWYAVSRNLVTNGGGGPINPGMGEAGRMTHPWIVLRDARGNLVSEPGGVHPLPVAAVVIAPGAALADQDRRGVAPSPENYLDRTTVRGTIYDNADADGCADAMTAPCIGTFRGEEFVLHGVTASRNSFNDRLAYVTVDELVRALEKRVLGEVAIAMGEYRDGFGAYPWLAGFRNPAFVASGLADGGSATHLSDGSGSFMGPPAGVRPGDVVVNLADGGRGVVSRVAGSVLEFSAMGGGVENDFDVGEAYLVVPSFKSDLSRRGLLPLHLEDEVFATRFGASWSLVDNTPTTATRHSGDARLVPPLADAMTGAMRTARDAGRCAWSDWTRGDCVGAQTIPAHNRADLGAAVRRTLELAFSIADHAPTVIPPTSGDVRRRSLTVNGARLTASPATAWSVRITDDDGTNQGTREFAIDSDTGGALNVGGIRYDLSVVYDDVDDARDELPEWFVENEWHHYIHAAFSADAVAGGNADGDGDCATPANDCLTLNVAGRRINRGVRALLISSGVPLARQDRSLGDCDGDGLGDDHLCTYLEGDNSDVSTPIRADTYSRGKFSALFNDQVRIIDPPLR